VGFVVLRGTGCVTWPDDIQSGLNRPHLTVSDAGHDTGAMVVAAESADADAAVAPDAGAELRPSGPKDCPSQTVDWTVDSAACSAPSGDPLADGASRPITDSTLDPTGSVTITCSAGTLMLSIPVCEPPKVFDVSGPTGCVRGYCDARAKTCGGVDPEAAKAICVFKGYADQTAFTTAPGKNGAAQCSADGVSCYNSLNTCNTIFASVTCRH
jgi:hypothetical protein